MSLSGHSWSAYNHLNKRCDRYDEEFEIRKNYPDRHRSCGPFYLDCPRPIIGYAVDLQKIHPEKNMGRD